MDFNKELHFFKKQLAGSANSLRAEGAKRYLKSPWKFYGVDIPTERKIVKTWLRNNKTVSFRDITLIAEKLWESQWHEEKTLAIMLLSECSKSLTLENMPLIEHMVNSATGWDHLDEISQRLVGPLIDNDPRTLSYLPKWAKNKNFWVRRASLLSQIPQFRRRAGDFALFESLAVPMFKEGDGWSPTERFFIRKAIGWVLREVARKQPELTLQFVQKHKSTMSGLTYREATRRLPPRLQASLE